MSEQERAGRWVRVSTAAQDERDQEPDIDRWIADHGYVPAETYRLHGKSAYKGMQQAELDRVIKDMRRGHISVLVVWQSSRIERRGAWNAFDLARRVKDAGGRIEYVKDTHLNMTNDMDAVTLALQSTMDNLSSKQKSDAVLKKHQSLKARNSFVGKPPFGYSLVSQDGIKVIVPNDDAATVKVIFERIADGESLRQVGESLGMWPRTVQVIVRRETYKGRHHHGADILTVPAIVSAELWRRANDRLSSTTRGRRGPCEGKQALLASVLYCGPCHDRGIESPMYRTSNGNYMRCTGTGRARRGCGHLVRIDAVEYQAVEHLTRDKTPHTITMRVADDRADRIEKLNDQLSDATARRDRVAVNRIMDELEVVEAETATSAVRTVETGQTVGQQWMSLGREERRAWLLREGWRIWAWKPESAEVGTKLLFVPGYDLAA